MGNMHADCPFCRRIREKPDLALTNSLAVAFEDAYPVNPGHMLIVSRRHVARYNDLTVEERIAAWDLARAACDAIETIYSPRGYNLGVNDGSTAGQTVPHVHIHVIPRYSGDVRDPRGGVRWVIPERAAYWDGPSHV